MDSPILEGCCDYADVYARVPVKDLDIVAAFAVPVIVSPSTDAVHLIFNLNGAVSCA
jgi:hypothetical protein